MNDTPPLTACADQAYDDVEHEIGEQNIQVAGFDMHTPVFGISALLILVFVAVTLMFPEAANARLVGIRDWAIDHFDWLFMVGANLFVLFCFALILLPVGRIRIGGPDAKPDFSRPSWFAMLFAAGMGIGLMFWSVAEPVAYFTGWSGTPLNVAIHTPEGKSLALGATMLHWGLHPWAMYGVVGLALAFFAYNKGLPLTIRAVFYPLLGNRIWGPIGHVIDTLAALATIFGLATSLGLGAQQAASGLGYLSGIENNTTTQMVLIALITGVAILSVVRGLDGGVKVLSNLNMVLALALLVFVTLAGSTSGFFANLFDLFGSYARNILQLSSWTHREDETWFHGWTIFYWAWWISWSPFVGMFIARVSRGRTVREFLTAVLVIPTLVCGIWVAAFGGTALDQVQANVGELANGVSDVSLSMFQMLANLPMAPLLSAGAICLVLLFFVTSSDSGSLVIAGITAGGKEDTPVAQRVFWATLVGLIAAALLYGGGKQALSALQAGAVTAGLPFTIVLISMCLSLYKGLSLDSRAPHSHRTAH
ncbi:BCCT family transporter [Microbulbifer rhizosphaerae]|uniref:BCCT family betaine/carnitine transporter n=1 Tax=Microbulbifer rhizosphaerae TaxID=1562603 RepID=A0A7W4Z9M6_9GAMM|nr:BCCT family transporter [Microbulbifer rhizosphaerae]MBB3061993.1 BCCT family betaine/carnitine transporter [Microbulbifer rhizosphaerae]